MSENQVEYPCDICPNDVCVCFSLATEEEEMAAVKTSEQELHFDEFIRRYSQLSLYLSKR